jgi:hypothetical protein
MNEFNKEKSSGSVFLTENSEERFYKTGNR